MLLKSFLSLSLGQNILKQSVRKATVAAAFDMARSNAGVVLFVGAFLDLYRAKSQQATMSPIL